jgi:hypothetical protein
MKKILLGIILGLAAVLLYKSCAEDNVEKQILQENTMLIQQQIQNVSKLIVTEGQFAEVYNYADSKALFGPYLIAQKKALVVVNAEVTIAYDLSTIYFEVDEEKQTVFVKDVPQPEIKINPDFEYYDVSADYFNPFDEKDYNAIKKNVNASLLKKVQHSALISNAETRLVSELSKLLVLTKTLGWTLVYDATPIKKMEELRLQNSLGVD